MKHNQDKPGGVYWNIKNEASRGNIIDFDPDYQSMSVESMRAYMDKKAQEIQDEAREAVNNERRQQNKIIAIFTKNLDLKTGRLDRAGTDEIIGTRSVDVSDDDRAEVLRLYAEDKISPATESRLLRRIMSAVGDKGEREVLESLDSKHEKRILATFSNRGFDKWEEVDSSDIVAFIARYPTPIEFASAFKDFVSVIRYSNGDEKAREYTSDGDALMAKIYGKQYEYWGQMQALREEAFAKQSQARSKERDNDHEWEMGKIAYRQETKEGKVACGDSVLYRPDQKVFGVFDGLGGEGRSGDDHKAATGVAEYMSHFIDRFPNIEYSASLVNGIYNAEAWKEETGIPGATTCTIAKIVNGDTLLYAHVGDCRLYVVHADGKVEQITQDEGEGHRLYNCIGGPRYAVVDQHGEYYLKRGDRVVMCSDGITGDYGSDIVSDEELAGIVMDSRNADEAADRLLQNARKNDDKTVLVFGDFS